MFFDKIAKKAVDTSKGDDLTEEVKRLGIAGKTVNELAASGLQISLRDKLRKHALAVDLIRKAEGTTAEQEGNDQRVQDSSADLAVLNPPAKQDSAEEVADYFADNQNEAVDKDESDGDLQFFDPAAEKKAQ